MTSADACFRLESFEMQRREEISFKNDAFPREKETLLSQAGIIHSNVLVFQLLLSFSRPGFFASTRQVGIKCTNTVRCRIVLFGRYLAHVSVTRVNRYAALGIQFQYNDRSEVHASQKANIGPRECVIST